MLVSMAFRMRGMRYCYGVSTSIRTPIHTYLLVMYSVSTNGEQAGLANSKMTIESLLEYS